MKRIPASILTMLGVVIFMTGCDRPGCKNTNPIFDKYSPQTKEYKDELVKQLARFDRSKLSYWMDSIQVDNNARFIHAHVQGDGLCAKIVLTIDSSEKGIEGIMRTSGMGYRGAELEDLRFDTRQDSASTAFIFREVGGIID